MSTQLLLVYVLCDFMKYKYICYLCHCLQARIPLAASREYFVILVSEALSYPDCNVDWRVWSDDVIMLEEREA